MILHDNDTTVSYKFKTDWTSRTGANTSNDGFSISLRVFLPAPKMVVKHPGAVWGEQGGVFCWLQQSDLTELNREHIPFTWAVVYNPVIQATKFVFGFCQAASHLQQRFLRSQFSGGVQQWIRWK